MRAFKVIKGGPEIFQVLADQTRRRIIYLLRAKEMTVSQIADELDLTPQAIYHNIRKLKDCGMVEVGREERVDHFIETYYRASAEIFYLEHGEAETKEVAEKRTLEALQSLSRIGLKVRTDPDVVAKVVEVERRSEQLGAKSELTDKIAGLEDIDFLTRQSLVYFVKMLTMSDADFTEYTRLQKELRKMLQTKLVELPA
jgi:DNA-binding transcriptional ArsR family regulator